MLNDGQWSEPRREDGKPFRSLVRKVDSEIAVDDRASSVPASGSNPQARYEVEATYRLRGERRAGRARVGERLPTRSPHCPQPSTGAPSGFPRLAVPSRVRRTTSRRSNSMSAGGPAEPASRSTGPPATGSQGGHVPRRFLRSATLWRSSWTFVWRMRASSPSSSRLSSFGMTDLSLPDMSPTRQSSIFLRGSASWARPELAGDLLSPRDSGTYLLSVGLYSKLDLNATSIRSEVYDYFDRSYEFRVVGNPALHNEIVRHPGRWRIEGRDPPMLDSVKASEGAHEIELT